MNKNMTSVMLALEATQLASSKLSFGYVNNFIFILRALTTKKHTHDHKSSAL